jgi:hypothetical protein
MSAFSSREFFPDQLLRELMELRVANPEFAWNAAQVRVQRKET